MNKMLKIILSGILLTPTIFVFADEPNPPVVTLTSPNGGEVWGHATRQIRWEATDPDQGETEKLKIKLEYSADNGATWVLIKTGLDNTGFYWWNIPALPSGSNYLVCITATDPSDPPLSDSDKSNGVFEIDNTPPSIVHNLADDINHKTRTITAIITDANGIRSSFVKYRRKDGVWCSAMLSVTGLKPDEYGATLRGLEDGDFIEYYIQAIDNLGNVERYPTEGPDKPYAFHVQLTTSPKTWLIYDDGTVEAMSYWDVGYADNRFAVRFTPPNPCTLWAVVVGIPTDWPDSDHQMFAVEIYDDSYGYPGTLLYGPDTTGSIGNVIGGLPPSGDSPPYYLVWAWVCIPDTPAPVVIADGDFYVAINQIYYPPQCEALDIDDDGTQYSRSYYYNHITTTWSEYYPDDRNLMIRACVLTGYYLPVVLASFQAAAGHGVIALHWTTASEVNCHRWEVHRSDAEDGEYAKIGELPGHGSTETMHTYQWINRQVTPEVTYYYKLKQVDFDGSEWWSYSVSATAAAATVPKTYALHQNYPNPFNPATEITYAIPKDEYVTLKVYNIQGAEVTTLVSKHQEANLHTVSWKADGLASGVYFCRLQAGEFGKTIKMVLLR